MPDSSPRVQTRPSLLAMRPRICFVPALQQKWAQSSGPGRQQRVRTVCVGRLCVRAMDQKRSQSKRMAATCHTAGNDAVRADVADRVASVSDRRTGCDGRKPGPPCTRSTINNTGVAGNTEGELLVVCVGVGDVQLQIREQTHKQSSDKNSWQAQGSQPRSHTCSGGCRSRGRWSNQCP